MYTLHVLYLKVVIGRTFNIGICTSKPFIKRIQDTVIGGRARNFFSMISVTKKLPLSRVIQGIWLKSYQKDHIAFTRSVASAPIPEIDSDELVKQLDAKDPGLLVLDVRSPEELASGTIRGFYNVPTPVFKQADTGPLDRAIHERIKHAKEVVVHCLFCSPGKRGPTAASALQQRLQVLGITPAPAVRVLKGGIDAFMAKHAGRSDLVTLPPGGWKVQVH